MLECTIAETSQTLWQLEVSCRILEGYLKRMQKLLEFLEVEPAAEPVLIETSAANSSQLDCVPSPEPAASAGASASTERTPDNVPDLVEKWYEVREVTKERLQMSSIERFRK